MGDIAGSAVAGGQPSRRLAAIMFTDLVGYSALAHRDEALAIELLELHRGWVREILPRHGGAEIETVGDAFLIEFPGALAAVECATAIQQRFADYNATAPEARRMQLRIGIHLGDVEHKDGKVMGDGVNIASRIHGMAEPGGICVSEQVHHAVRNRAGLRFRSLGRPALKNIATPLELFVPAGEGSAPAPGRARLRTLAAPAALAVVVALLGAGLWRLAARPAATATPSIAVLPFDNLSADADSGYFTDGLHDTVIGHLARIKDLKVISRTSVMGYRGKHGNLRAIAAELGVGHVLEGSVQRAGNRLRVAAQLIDARNDAHVWSSEYDRELADVFAVQADIAQQVAGAVHARLTPAEQARIARIPTGNREAYDLFLRALAVERQIDALDQPVREAIAWLEQAVALDPGFALAHAHLSLAHDRLYWYSHDPAPARRELAGRSADAALRLDPGLAEARVAKATYLYHGFLDYAGALAELEVARSIAPGHAGVHLMLGAIYRRQGRWDEALAGFERSATLDPMNAKVVSEYAWTLELLRRYAEADRVYARAEALGGPESSAAWSRAWLHFHRTGELEAMERVVAAIPAGFDPGCGPSMARWTLAMLQRRHREAAETILACRDSYLSLDASERSTREFFAAYAYSLAGDESRARALARQARAQVTATLKTNPDLPETRMQLALVLLILGERQAALAEVDTALAAMPVSRDAILGTYILGLAATFHAHAGETERALDELERVLQMPGGPSVHTVRAEPFFDSLRGHPRYQKLMAEHLQKMGG